ncbi:FtsX-like permease family protein [Aquimixticola soesokkakensis]|uniref:FtsX-like permease family protein n=1 Tax=Aquimixticola soesokkakensis TaxID=1519096 RepID=A0A1Y5SYG5_9RHOB|nr:FtsX-like permease family protein [Aquimixticola soesokkakensis]SLN47979.1 FtsX-like permease family protein [Aquimixticola soesokkakensis]
MSLRLAARYAGRELRGGLRNFRIFLACLALGVMAIAAVGSLRSGIEAGLAQQGARLLGGDAEMEFTYRFAAPGERAWMEENTTALSETADFRSMAAANLPADRTATAGASTAGAGSGPARSLTQIKAVDAAYPLIGAVELDPPMPLAQAFAGKDGLAGAVMAPELMERLGVVAGDPVTLGGAPFVVMAALVNEPDNLVGGIALGPRTLALTRDLQAAGLLGAGTLFESQYRLLLPEGADLDAVEARATEALGGAGFRWRDARRGAPGVERFVNRLADFLVLVGLAGLAVGGVGVSAAVRAYLDRKTGVIATLRTLGASQSFVFQVYFLQIFVLALAGIAVGAILGALIPLAVMPVIAARSPVPILTGIYPVALAQAAAYGVLSAGLFTLWPLAQAEHIRPAALFRSALAGPTGWPRARYLCVLAGLVAALVAMAVVFTGSTRLAVWFCAGVVVSFGVLLGLSAAIRFFARRLSQVGFVRKRFALRAALASIAASPAETRSVVLSLGLGLTVLCAIGQVDSNIRGAITRDLPDKAPSFFVVDIQSDQIAAFRSAISGTAGVDRLETAPMLRGIITQINGQDAAEVAPDSWVVRGDRGITYSDLPPDNSEVTAGAWWPEDYSGPPQISFGQEQAEEIGLALGDTLTVNVLGRDIRGEVTSFRAVDFSGAGMGFVLSMNSAALSGAPHTFIATIYASTTAEGDISRLLGRDMPNVTVIGVRDAIAQVADIVRSLAAASLAGAGATLVTGALVLIGAATAGEGRRRYDAAIFKALGASRRVIFTSFALRSALLGAAAALVSVGLGMAGAWGVMRFVMEADFVPDLVIAGLIGGIGVGLSVLASLRVISVALRSAPARVLRADD